MRIHTRDTAQNLQLLAGCIHKDPASLENWKCLYMRSMPDTSSEAMHLGIVSLKECHPEADCDIILCEDNDALFLSQNLQGIDLAQLGLELCEMLYDQFAINDLCVSYDMFSDWRSILPIITAKTHGSSTMHADNTRSEPFGEVSCLQEAFIETAKKRSARMPLHVLIVEDDPLTRRIVTSSFKDKYAMISAATAHEAVANYLLYAPDIVFLDIGLPDASGFEVLKQILSCDPDAYVVMFSSNCYLDNVVTALAQGASGFVAKPFKRQKMDHYILDSALHHHKYA